MGLSEKEVSMVVGRSGRIVVDLDPGLKQRLHARLRSEGRDLKGWLLERAEEYLGESPRREQPPSELGELERRVLEAMSSEALARHHVDHLLDATGLDLPQIREALMRLELEGRVVHDGGLYRRVRPS